jgi:hypothetical protein
MRISRIGRMPETDSTRGHSRVRRIVATCAGLLAVGLVLTFTAIQTKDDSPSASSTRPASLEFTPTYEPESGPDGHTWYWIGESGGATLIGRGRYWLTFRGRSLRVKRKLSFATRDGQEDAVDVTPREGVHVVGPFAIRGKSSIGIHPVPGPRRAASDDARRVSVFISNLRLASTPIAALPGVGFYRTEYGGGPFNWLARRGRVDVAAADPSVRRVWLRFWASSIDVARRLTISGGNVVASLTIPARKRLVSIGPFSLNGGRLKLIFESSDPRRYGTDKRPLSVKVQALSASTAGANQPP